MFQNYLSFLCDLISASAAGIAIFIFFTKRKEFGTIISALKSHALQVSLMEVHGKIDRLNNLDADVPSQKTEAMNILNDLHGHLSGNKILSVTCSRIILRISKFINSPDTLSEARKRGCISHLKENLRSIHSDDISNLVSKETNE